MPSREKVKAFFQEFPFLSKIVRQERVMSVKVSRINLDVFGSNGDFYLFAENGSLILKLKSFGFKTLGDVMMQLENPGCVYYAVRLEYYNKLETLAVPIALVQMFLNFLRPTYSLTVFKPPKSFTLSGWKEEQLRRLKEEADAEVEKEINESDRVE